MKATPHLSHNALQNTLHYNTRVDFGKKRTFSFISQLWAYRGINLLEYHTDDNTSKSLAIELHVLIYLFS